jgi:L,D-transpeptidase ErfK/SrfK
MRRWWWVLPWLCLPGAGLAAVSRPALAPPPLYQQVAGGEEDCQVPAKTTLSLLAAAKGVKWTVVAKHNGLGKPYKITPGMVLKINTRHIVPGELDDGLVINLPELIMYRFVNGVYQRRYSLAVGKPSWPTPTGNFKISEKRRNPTWNVPPSIQAEMEEQGLEVVERVPPGPKNPLGAYWMGTTASGVGIHATNRPWSVGYYVSHGCIRMLPEEIAQLFPQIEVGTPVKIIYRPIKLALTPQGRVYLEVHPNIYNWRYEAREVVEELARRQQLAGRIDWEKVPAVLKAKEGVAQDITLEPGRPEPIRAGGAPGTGEASLGPLQGRKAALE